MKLSFGFLESVSSFECLVLKLSCSYEFSPASLVRTVLAPSSVELFAPCTNCSFSQQVSSRFRMPRQARIVRIDNRHRRRFCHITRKKRWFLVAQDNGKRAAGPAVVSVLGVTLNLELQEVLVPYWVRGVFTVTRRYHRELRFVVRPGQQIPLFP